MIYELSNSDYEKVRPLFRALEFHLSSAAVLDRNNPGRVFVDNPINPRTAFILSPEGCYLAGEAHNDAFNRALNEAIFTKDFFFEDRWALFFACHPDDWQDQLTVIFDPRSPITQLQRHYICRKLGYDWQSNIEEGFTLHRIDEILLSRPGLIIPHHVGSWMVNNWGSTSDFLKRGFGFATIHNDEVVSWSLADCISGDACEIGIHTTESYRRRGLATVTAAATVDYALSNGFSTIGWHCPEDNLGSIGTAERVGFEKERSYAMHVLIPNEAVYLAEMGHA